MVQSSNPKQKYHQQRDKSEKNTPSSLVDKQHKQKAPLLVTVPETVDGPLFQPQSDLPASDQMQESELCEEGEIISELGTTVGDGIEDKEVISVDGTSSKEGDQLIQKHTESKETELLVTADESKLEGNHPLSRSPPDTEQEQEATAQVFLPIFIPCVRNSLCLMQVESDDEEKKALLTEENIQLLEESERVDTLYMMCMHLGLYM